MKTSTTALFALLVVAGLTVASAPAYGVHAGGQTVEIPDGVGLCTEGNVECYSPLSVTVSEGTTVTWANNDAATPLHTITSGLISDRDNVGSLFDSRFIQTGDYFEHRFDEAGTYPYFCQLHPRMTGLVIVEPATAESDRGNERSTPTPLPPGQIGGVITITTDKDSYSAGETVIVEGNVRQNLGSAASLLVLEPSGTSRVLVEQIRIDDAGSFSTTFVAGGPNWSTAGQYEIVVNYGIAADIVTGSTFIEYTGGVVAPAPAPEPPEDGPLAGITSLITGGTIESISIGSDEASIIVIIDAVDDGELTLNIPRDIFESKADGQTGVDIPFIVIVDSAEADVKETAATYTRTVVIPFTAGSKVIEVFGSWIISESDKPQSPITIATNKKSYSAGETVTVTGKIRQFDQGTAIFQVLGPNGQRVLINQFTADSTGSFSVAFVAGTSSWSSTGSYEIVVAYGPITAMTTIEFTGSGNRQNPPPIPPPPGQDRDSITVTTDKRSYAADETITVSGKVPQPRQGSVSLTVSAPNGDRVFVDQLVLDIRGAFSATFVAGTSSWPSAGTYEITVSHGILASNVITGTTAIEFIVVDPDSPTIVIPDGVGLCTGQNAVCYSPMTVTVSPGTTVTWQNNDTTAALHTVTSGEIDNRDSVGSLFDSHLFQTGDSFVHTFYEIGEYPYFCQLHPRMSGLVVVEDANAESDRGDDGETPATTPAPEPKEIDPLVEARSSITGGTITSISTDPDGSSLVIVIKPDEGKEITLKIPRDVFVSITGDQTMVDDNGLTAPLQDLKSRFASFMTEGNDPQIYVDRYNNEPAYKVWFDTYFAGLTIEDAAGLK